jgi:hypothetical protein
MRTSGRPPGLPARGARSGVGTSVIASLAVPLLAAALLIGGCASSEGTADIAGATTGGSIAPAAAALLTRLATDGSDAVFDRRFGGELDAGNGAAPLVFAGTSGDQAIVYVCDGTSGTWFTGSVDGSGNGSLRSTDGGSTVNVASADGGLRASFTGGAFGGRSTTAAPLDTGDGQLIRLEATAEAGGSRAAVGGIIISPSGLRGVLTTSITDGSSNTLVFGESTTTTTVREAGTRPTITRPTTTLADGNSNTVNIGSTTTTIREAGTRPTTTLADGSSNTVTVSGSATPPAKTVVSTTDTGQLTVAFVVSGSSSASGSAPGTTAPVSCAATAAALNDVVRALSKTLGALQSQLASLRIQRNAVAQQTKTAPGTDRTAAQQQLDKLDHTIASVQGQIAQVTAQIDELTRQVPTCPTTATTK